MGDMSMLGSMSFSAQSKMIVQGHMELTGTISMPVSAKSYAGGCDVFLPTAIQADSLTMSNSAAINVYVDGSAISSCSAPAKRDFMVDNSDTLVVVNTTASMN